MGTGRFQIKEWHCSSEEVRRELSKQDKLASKSNPGPLPIQVVYMSKESLSKVNEVSLDGEQSIKALGVSLNPQGDTIRFEIKLKQEKPYTKQVILSSILRLFEPLGLASVVTIKAKIRLQEIWKLKKFDWDDPLPKEMHAIWEKLFAEIKKLRSVQFAQCLQH